MPGFAVNGGSRAQPSNRRESHRANRWLVESFGFPNGIVGGTQTSVGASPRVYAKNANLPTVGFDIGKAPGAAIDYPYASKVTYEPITITFYDVMGLYDLFDKWRQAMWTPEEGIKMINEYAGQPVLVKRDGRGNVTERFTMFNAFPKSISHTELTYESSDILLVKITYVYSHFEFEQISNTGTGF